MAVAPAADERRSLEHVLANPVSKNSLDRDDVVMPLEA